MGKWTNFNKQHESYRQDDKNRENDKRNEDRKGKGRN